MGIEVYLCLCITTLQTPTLLINVEYTGHVDKQTVKWSVISL